MKGIDLSKRLFILSLILLILFLGGSTAPFPVHIPPLPVHVVKKIPFPPYMDSLPTIKAVVLVRDIPTSRVSQKVIDFFYRTCAEGWKGQSVPPMLIIKQIWLESEWYTWAKGKNIDKKTGEVLSYDWNYMQINDFNIAYYVHLYHDANRKEKSYDVKHNVYDNLQIGIRRMADLYRKYKSWKLTVAAYNGGERNVDHNTTWDSTKAYVRIIDPIENWWNRSDVILIKQSTEWPYKPAFLVAFSK